MTDQPMDDFDPDNPDEIEFEDEPDQADQES
jgi:hypothetical protein